MEFCTDPYMTWLKEKPKIKFDIEISDYHLNKIIDKLKRIGNKRLILYPAGQVSRNILQKIDLQEKNVIGVGDKTKRGKFYGQTIYSPNEMLSLNINVILVCTMAFEDEIYTELQKHFQNSSIEIMRIFSDADEYVISSVNDMGRHIDFVDYKIHELSKKFPNKSVNNSKKKIIFISYNQPSHLCYRYSYVLKKKCGYETTLFHLGKLKKSHRMFLKTGFDSIIEIDNYPLLIELFRKNDGCLFHVTLPCWGVNILYYILKVRSNQKVIWDVYDFLDFYPAIKKSKKEDYYIYYYFQKYIYEYIDAIIYQDDPDGVNKYIKNKLKKNIPFLHFNSLVLDDFMINSKELYESNQEPYKVNFAGDIYPCKDSLNNIIKSGCKLEVFLNPCVKRDNRRLKKKGLNFNESVFPPQLQTSMRSCNYALLTHHTSMSRHSDYSFTQRFIVNLEAGLPMIASDTYKYMANLVEKYNVGIVCTLEELKNLREILKHHDYMNYIENIIQARQQLDLYANIHRIEELYYNLLQ